MIIFFIKFRNIQISTIPPPHFFFFKGNGAKLRIVFMALGRVSTSVNTANVISGLGHKFMALH